MSLNRSLLLSSLLASALALTGCSNMVETATANPSSNLQGSLSGIVHGGQQPIYGATVTLWAAGNAGYGSAATALATTTTDINGGFNFGPGSGHTYTCPSSVSSTESQSIYLTSSGGQPTSGTTNSQAALMVALGDCLSVQAANPNITMNEVTTVASITALQQFFSPNTTSGLGSIGTTSTNTLGLANAMKTVANLVNIASGTAYTTTTRSAAVSGYTTNPVITITPEQAKINTEADILAACINTGGSTTPPAAANGCNTLLTNAGASALDTLQAAYAMATVPAGTGTPANCTTGTAVTTAPSICALFGLVTSSSPFQPTLTSAPTDFTLGVTYSSASTQTIAATGVYFLNSPEYLAIDSLGNVWAVNNSTSTAGAAGNSVSELSPVGAPEAQVLTSVGQLTAPRNIVVDPSNNLYVGNYGAGGLGNTIIEYNATLLTAQTYTLSSTGPEALASDGAGNIYVANYGGAPGSGDLEIIAAGNNASTGSATRIATAVSVGPNSSLAIDSYNNLWLSNAASTATTQFICTANPCTATATTAGGQTGPQSVAVDHANNIWVGNNTGTVSEIASTTNSTIGGVSGSPFSGGGLSNPTRSIFGGAGNQWITNYASGAGSVTELTPAGAPVSPSGGFVHTFAGATGIAIDGSGNVWVGNAAAAAPNGFITEIVGASGPVITPYASNLPSVAGGANTIGNRP